jgi:hypothetical protein
VVKAKRQIDRIAEQNGARYLAHEAQRIAAAAELERESELIRGEMRLEYMEPVTESVQ